MIKTKRLVCLMVILILGIGLVVSTPETTFGGNSETLSIQGKLFDATTLNPIKKTGISISIKPDALQSKELYQETKKTDEQGNYVFNTIAGGFLSQKKYDIIFTFEDKEYVNNKYVYTVSEEAGNNKLTHLTFEFGLIKPTDKRTVSGHVVNVIDKAPIPNLGMTIKIVERKPEDDPRKVPARQFDQIRCQTDDQGNYQVKIPGEYLDGHPLVREDNEKKFFSAGVTQVNLYDTIIFDCHYDCVENGSGRVRKYTINFTQRIENFTILNLQKEGTITGVIVNGAGSTIAKIPITVKLGEIRG